MSTTSASRHTSTSKIYVTYGSCYQMTLQRQSPAPRLLVGSTTVMQYCTPCMVPRLRTLTSTEQCLQNRLARVVSNTRRRDHITPVAYSPTCTGCQCGIGLSTRSHWSHSRRWRRNNRSTWCDDDVSSTSSKYRFHEKKEKCQFIRHYETPRQLRSRGVNILQTSATAL